MDLTIGKNQSLVQKYEQFAPDCCCGDAIVAAMLKDEAGIELNMDGDNMFTGEAIPDLVFKDNCWCTPIISLHHLNSHEIEILWEYERSRGPQKGNITYADMYRDFVLPYVDDRVDNWDNNIGGSNYKIDEDEYKFKDGEVIYPGVSVDLCERACTQGNNCLSWRYDHDDKVCTLWDKFKLGRSTRKWLSLTSNHDRRQIERAQHHMESGWNMERIRKFRPQKRCDVASHSDNSDPEEGWWWQREEVKEELAKPVTNDEVEQMLDPQHSDDDATQIMPATQT
jgi:hypothetical protein